MRTAHVRLLLGATLLVAGFGVLTDGSPIKNPLVQSAVGFADMKERQCRKASVAAGTMCPKGCEPRPARVPEDRATPPECHSALWAATCGDACAPAFGYARTEDGSLVDATRLSLKLEREPDQKLLAALAAARVTLEPRFDGLYRYNAILFADASLEKTKKRLAALPGVQSVEEIAK